MNSADCLGLVVQNFNTLAVAAVSTLFPAAESFFVKNKFIKTPTVYYLPSIKLQFKFAAGQRI